MPAMPAPENVPDQLPQGQDEMPLSPAATLSEVVRAEQNPTAIVPGIINIGEPMDSDDL